MSFVVTPSLIWKTGAIFTTLGISTGAFGAHALKSRVPNISPQSISSWSTASSYLIYNGLGLLAVSLHPRFNGATGIARSSGLSKFVYPAITIGTLMFSLSIFGLVLDRERFKWMGPVTPLGGLGMIGGRSRKRTVKVTEERGIKHDPSSLPRDDNDSYKGVASRPEKQI